jgi:hypothetical protein
MFALNFNIFADFRYKAALDAAQLEASALSAELSRNQTVRLNLYMCSMQNLF